MRTAYEAGTNRVLWEEGICRDTAEPPTFEQFMRQTYNDPRIIDFVVNWMEDGNDKVFEIHFTAANKEEAARQGRLLLEDANFVYFNVSPKTY